MHTLYIYIILCKHIHHPSLLNPPTHKRTAWLVLAGSLAWTPPMIASRGPPRRGDIEAIGGIAWNIQHTGIQKTFNILPIYIYIHRLLSWSMVYTCNLMILCMVWSYVCDYYNMNNVVESEGLHVYPSMHLAHVRQWKEDCTGCAQVWLISLTLEMIISVGGHIHHFLCHIQNTWIKYVDHISISGVPGRLYTINKKH